MRLQQFRRKTDGLETWTDCLLKTDRSVCCVSGVYEIINKFYLHSVVWCLWVETKHHLWRPSLLRGEIDVTAWPPKNHHWSLLWSFSIKSWTLVVGWDFPLLKCITFSSTGAYKDSIINTKCARKSRLWCCGWTDVGLLSCVVSSLYVLFPQGGPSPLPCWPILMLNPPAPPSPRLLFFQPHFFSLLPRSFLWRAVSDLRALL